MSLIIQFQHECSCGKKFSSHELASHQLTCTGIPAINNEDSRAHAGNEVLAHAGELAHARGLAHAGGLAQTGHEVHAHAGSFVHTVGENHAAQDLAHTDAQAAGGLAARKDVSL